MKKFDVAVIGAGPAGMAAALAASESGCKVLLVERAQALGGILRQCTHKGFGLIYFGEELTGQEYAARFAGRVERSAIEVMTDTMVLSLEGDTLTLSGKECGLTAARARAIVLASGCRERPIGALPVTGTRPSGVLTAGGAQYLMNIGGYDIGSKIIILGSGDVGMIVARQLAQAGKEVVCVIEKEPACGGLTRNRVQCLDAYGIPLQTLHTVTEIHGTGRINAVTVKSLESGAEQKIACDTLVTSVGLIPERELMDAPDERLFICGNACYVHDLVDDVTHEAERTGMLAAAYAKGERADLPEEDFTAETAHGRICIGCPKGCCVRQTSEGWHGISCGRAEPVL